MYKIKIGERCIGEDEQVFFIAEAGVNHNGDREMAHRLVDVAVEAGADAIKFQTFKAESLISSHAPKAKYQLQTTDASESQLEMVRNLELSMDTFRELQNHCQEKGVLFMSTPFDEESVDFLSDIGVPVFKIPSGEITNIPFLTYVASKGKPMILSTGMSYLGEVETAVRTIEKTGNCELVLLHCVSNYPAAPEDVNLYAMQTMSRAFCVPVGFSDHTSGIEVALAAVALGACVIEKHFTLDMNLPGPDHQASLEPDQLTALVRGIRKVENALGNGIKRPTASEADTIRAARRSLVAACDINAGTMLTEKVIAIRRPGSGIAPALLPLLIGRCMNVNVTAGTLLEFNMLQ